MKKKLKSKKFWLAAAAAVILILQLAGVKVNVPFVDEVIGAVCGLLILLGLLQDDTAARGKGAEQAQEQTGEIQGTAAQENQTDDEAAQKPREGQASLYDLAALRKSIRNRRKRNRSEEANDSGE